MTAIYIGSADAKAMYQEFLLSDPTHVDANVDYYIEWLVDRITDQRGVIENLQIQNKTIIPLLEKEELP